MSYIWKWINNIMNLIQFLKTYSKVSNEFIDDFFGLYNENEKYEFIIDLDKIVKWLHIRKGTLKETLIESYIENIDYIIKKM